MDKKIEERISQYCTETAKHNIIDSELYSKYEVKRGLRDISGKGVLAGLTEISEVLAYLMEEGDLVPCEGRLNYRGINVEDLVKGFIQEKRFGFEETTYLLLFGELPTTEQLKSFKKILATCMTLPEEFVRNTIMSVPGKDMMNMISRSILTLYSYDDNADDTSLENVMLQCLKLIAQFPSLVVYNYQAYAFHYKNQSLVIHPPLPELSFAENILHMLRPDSNYTELEAQILDLCLVLHAEHGGGNNSTFTNHVVTSSGTDTYSAMVASLSSLKGPKHGGANVKVMAMFDNIKENIKDWYNEDEIEAYIEKLVDKQAFDKTGLVYGIGHAVYSLSDPRATTLKSWVEKLAKQKGFDKEFALYSAVEKLAPKVIGEKRKMYKGVSANVDFYSGLIYHMLDLPAETYTPLFAAARMAGWSAHRLEELVNGGKIIRPAYKSVMKQRDYVSLDKR